MIMSYNERRDAVLEDYKDFHIKMGYSLEATLYATIGEAAYSPLYTQTDEICIYITFALILIDRGDDSSFLRSKLEELASKRYMPQYEQELESDFPQFLKDCKSVIGWRT